MSHKDELTPHSGEMEIRFLGTLGRLWAIPEKIILAGICDIGTYDISFSTLNRCRVEVYG